ncbi:hypothetical protein [Rhizobium sp. BE258]|uniref:hypothetical protein n=1 Tax=Rhizobium sp. BE258 TaxID=2817722 RepID=UPI002856F58B|nr:hypothetical protein [Rhizobium sp. BE258]MDR7147613.1 hypothetical protein [Rhizobium sp. BE258]
MLTAPPMIAPVPAPIAVPLSVGVQAASIDADEMAITAIEIALDILNSPVASPLKEIDKVEVPRKDSRSAFVPIS